MTLVCLSSCAYVWTF